MFAFVIKVLTASVFLWAFTCWVAWQLAGRETVVEYHAVASPMPPDDAALKEWFVQQSGFSDVQIVRKENRLKIHYVTSTPGFAPPIPPWSELGYELTGLDYTITQQHKTDFGLFDLRAAAWRPFALAACIAAGLGLALVTRDQPRAKTGE
jgi:hypothetical protein